MHRAFGSVSLLVIGILLGNVVSSLAAPSNRVINSCVDRKTGAMRYVSSGRCRSTELSVSWNVQGPTGPRGASGDQGVQGPRGASGEAPNTILSGASEPSVLIGKIGDFFINASSNLIYGPKTVSGWPNAISLIGPRGPAGETGPTGPAGSSSSSSSNTVRSGTGAPTNSTGSDGDFYIDTSANKIHGPKSGGVWPSGVSLVGPAGATGGTGSAGAQGPAGQGVLANISPVLVSKSNADADSVSTSVYTTVTSIGTDIEISLACGYESISNTSTTAWSLAVKAPSGSKIMGQTSYRNSPGQDFISGTANGTRQRLQHEGQPIEMTNDEFFLLNVFGSSHAPVVVHLFVQVETNSCTASGVLQTA